MRSRARGITNIPGWPKLRKSIIERDSYRCRVCASDDLDLEVHHIDYDRANNDPGNLVTLCGDCHRGIHQERYKPWEHEDWPVPWGTQDRGYFDPA